LNILLFYCACEFFVVRMHSEFKELVMKYLEDVFGGKIDGEWTHISTSTPNINYHRYKTLCTVSVATNEEWTLQKAKEREATVIAKKEEEEGEKESWSDDEEDWPKDLVEIAEAKIKAQGKGVSDFWRLKYETGLP